MVASRVEGLVKEGKNIEYYEYSKQHKVCLTSKLTVMQCDRDEVSYRILELSSDRQTLMDVKVMFLGNHSTRSS